MGIFNDILKSDETLLKNEYALDFAFVPKLIPYREVQQKAVANCIKPLLLDKPGRNALVHGPPGVGKTVAIKHLLRELEDNDDFSDDLELIFINCWQKNSSYKVAVEICDQIGYAFTQNKKTDDLYKLIAEKLNKKKAVFVFDEVDKAEDLDFIYTLIESIYKKTIILITNYKALLLDMDERIKSRLLPQVIEFKEYTLPETKFILEKRCDIAFKPNVISSKILDIISNKAYEMKDVRSGLYLLREACVDAEGKAAKKVEEEHANVAIERLDLFTKKSIQELEEEERIILQLAQKHAGERIGNLFKIYQKEGGKISYKTFQRKIAKLGERNYIEVFKSTGKGGNTTIINGQKKLGDFK